MYTIESLQDGNNNWEFRHVIQLFVFSKSLHKRLTSGVSDGCGPFPMA
jgi:hypothetical protein